MPDKHTPLRAYFREVYVPDRVNLRAGSIAQIETTIAIFGRHLGRAPTIDDLDEPTLRQFKAAYSAGLVPGQQQRPPSAATVNSKLRDLCALWRLAWDKHDTRKAPRKIRRAREDRRQPVAYSLAEMRQILQEAGRMQGTVGTAGRHPHVIAGGLWWTALILTCYSTAARIGALLAVRAEDYDGTRIFLRAKTQKQHADQSVWPSAEAIVAIDAMHDARRATLFWWPYGRRYLYRCHRRLLDRAGIVSTRRGMDQFQKYRRTGLSHVAAQNEDQAVKLAGHSSPAITRRNYLDPDIVNPSGAALLVPSLADPPGDPDPDPIVLSIQDYRAG